MFALQVLPIAVVIFGSVVPVALSTPVMTDKRPELPSPDTTFRTLTITGLGPQIPASVPAAIAARTVTSNPAIQTTPFTPTEKASLRQIFIENPAEYQKWCQLVLGWRDIKLDAQKKQKTFHDFRLTPFGHPRQDFEIERQMKEMSENADAQLHDSRLRLVAEMMEEGNVPEDLSKTLDARQTTLIGTRLPSISPIRIGHLTKVKPRSEISMSTTRTAASLPPVPTLYLRKIESGSNIQIDGFSYEAHLTKLLAFSNELSKVEKLLHSAGKREDGQNEQQNRSWPKLHCKGQGCPKYPSPSNTTGLDPRPTVDVSDEGAPLSKKAALFCRIQCRDSRQISTDAEAECMQQCARSLVFPSIISTNTLSARATPNPDTIPLPHSNDLLTYEGQPLSKEDTNLCKSHCLPFIGVNPSSWNPCMQQCARNRAYVAAFSSANSTAILSARRIIPTPPSRRSTTENAPGTPLAALNISYVEEPLPKQAIADCQTQCATWQQMSPSVGMKCVKQCEKDTRAYLSSLSSYEIATKSYASSLAAHATATLSVRDTVSTTSSVISTSTPLSYNGHSLSEEATAFCESDCKKFRNISRWSKAQCMKQCARAQFYTSSNLNSTTNLSSRGNIATPASTAEPTPTATPTGILSYNGQQLSDEATAFCERDCEKFRNISRWSRAQCKKQCARAQFYASSPTPMATLPSDGSTNPPPPSKRSVDPLTRKFEGNCGLYCLTAYRYNNAEGSWCYSQCINGNDYTFPPTTS